MNRYQRRKYGSSLAPRSAPARRWQIYVVAIMLLVVVICVRLFMHR